MCLKWLCPGLECYCTDVKAVVVSEKCETEYYLSKDVEVVPNSRGTKRVSTVAMMTGGQEIGGQRRVTMVVQNSNLQKQVDAMMSLSSF